jgi:hypothetical protein
MVESAPPRQSVVRLSPLVLLFLFARETAKDFSDIFPGSKILAGNSTAELPTTSHKSAILILLISTFYHANG